MPARQWAHSWGRRNVERPADIFDNDLRMLFDGDLNVAGHELELGFVEPPVKIQLIHLKADIQLRRIPADFRPGGGNEIQSRLGVDVGAQGGEGELRQGIAAADFGLEQQLPLLGVSGCGLIGGLLALLGVLLNLLGCGGSDGALHFKGVDIQPDRTALDTQTAFVPRDFQIRRGVRILQPGVRGLHLDFNGDACDFNELVHKSCRSPLYIKIQNYNINQAKFI